MQFWMVAAVALVALYFFFRGKSVMVPAEAVLSAGEAKKWIASTRDVQILDVRTKMEYQQGHLPSCKLIPLQELQGRMKELDTSKPLFVYCAHGNRSAVALNLLQQNGFPGAKHLRGGIVSWHAEGLPVVR